MNKQQNQASEHQPAQLEDLTVVGDGQAEVKGGPSAGRDILIGGTTDFVNVSDGIER